MRLLMKVHTPPTVLPKGSHTSLIWTRGRTCKGRKNELSCIIHRLLFQLLSHVWLFSDSVDCSPPGSSVHGIIQARIMVLKKKKKKRMEWAAIPFSRGIFPTQGSKLCLLLDKKILYHWATWEAFICNQQNPDYRMLQDKCSRFFNR